MGDGLEERVRRAFAAEAAGSYADNYLETIRQNWRESSQRMRGPVILLLFCIAAFELLNEAKVSEISLGPAKLTDATPILQALPAVASYVIYEVVYLAELTRRYAKLHRAVVAEAYPALERENLELPLGPPASTLWGPSPWFAAERSTSGVIRWWFAMSVGALAILLSAGFGFQIYAFMSLFDGPNTLLVWASFAFSLLMIARTALLIYFPLD